MTNPTPGWYSDPEVPGQQRYWDGERWTEHVAPLVHLDAPTRIDVSFRPGFDERAGLTFNDGIITIRDENGDDPPPFSISDVVAIGWNRNGAEGTSIDGICALVQPVSGKSLATQQQNPLRIGRYLPTFLPDSLDRSLRFVLIDVDDFPGGARNFDDEWPEFLCAVVAPLAMKPNIMMTDDCRRDLTGVIQSLIAMQARKQAKAQRKAARAETSFLHRHHL